MKFTIFNRYQDEGWQSTGETFPDFDSADKKAAEYSADAICYGMLAVVADNGKIMSMYGAGAKGKQMQGRLERMW